MQSFREHERAIDMILALRTDTAEAELYLLDSDGHNKDKIIWNAGRELSNQLLVNINLLLNNQSITLKQLKAIVVFKGPGSFTGLRIGIAVANALAYGLAIPIAAASGEQWAHEGVKELSKHKNYTPVSPLYGSDPHITTPKK